MERTRLLEKSPRRYRDPICERGLNFFYPLIAPILKQHIIFCHIFFGFNTLKVILRKLPPGPFENDLPRPHLYDFGYPRQPSPRVTLAEVT